MPEPAPLIQVQRLGKKFSRSLKHSLWYGVRDIASDLNPLSTRGTRPNDGEGGGVGLRTSEFWALSDVSFELHRGDCLGIVGRNGAGKSTLLKILSGLIKPDCGRVRISGRVGALIELGAGFSPILTGRENIYIKGAILGFDRKDMEARVDQIVEFAQLEDSIDSPVRSYSSGMKIRLGFAVAAQMNPDVLIIDEVLAVGDMGFKHRCLNRIEELLKNCAVVFVSHSMNQISRISSKLMVLRSGKVASFGDDVALGITRYQEEFAFGDVRQTVGTGEVVLAECRLNVNGVNHAGDAIPVVQFGSSLSFEFGLDIASHIDSVSVAAVIWDQQMRQVAVYVGAGESERQFVVENTAGRRRIRLEIDAVRFNSGVHAVTLGVVDAPTRKHLLRVDQALQFNVEHYVPNEGGTIWPGAWRVIDS
jgi:lipopolysaccharide transport system ATP-binding protein